MLLFMFICNVLSAQIKYSGELIDSESKESIPFVNISIKGTAMGTCSDINGRFDLCSSSKNICIVISSIGFKTDTILLKDKHSKIYMTAESYALNTISVSGKKRFNLKTIVKKSLKKLKKNREQNCLSSFKVTKNVHEDGKEVYRETAKLDVSFNSEFKYLMRSDAFVNSVSNIENTVNHSYDNHILHSSRKKLNHLFCLTKDLSHHKDFLYNFNKFVYKLIEISDSQFVVKCLQTKDTLIATPYRNILWKRTRTLHIDRGSMRIDSIEGADFLFAGGENIMSYNSSFVTKYKYLNRVAYVSKINVLTSNYSYESSTKTGVKTYYSDVLDRIHK